MSCLTPGEANEGTTGTSQNYMINWSDRNVINLDVLINDRDVVKLHMLKAVSLYVSFFELTPTLLSIPFSQPTFFHSFQVTLHTRANACGMGLESLRNCISSSPSLSCKCASTWPSRKYLSYSLSSTVAVIAEFICRGPQNIHGTYVHTRILVTSLCASLINLSHQSYNTVGH